MSRMIEISQEIILESERAHWESNILAGPSPCVSNNHNSLTSGFFSCTVIIINIWWKVKHLIIISIYLNTDSPQLFSKSPPSPKVHCKLVAKNSKLIFPRSDVSQAKFNSHAKIQLTTILCTVYSWLLSGNYFLSAEIVRLWKLLEQCSRIILSLLNLLTDKTRTYSLCMWALGLFICFIFISFS